MADPLDLSDLDPSKFKEHPPKNPIAKRVSDELDNLPAIRTFHHLGRLTDTFMFIADLLDAYEPATTKIIGRKMQGVPEELATLMESAPKALIEFTVKVMESEFKEKVQQYKPWLLNQGLVMLCTILDVFLEHVVETIYFYQPKRLLTSEDARKVDLRSVIEADSTAAVIRKSIQRESRRFSFQNTNDRLEYLEKRCEIKRAKIFDWSRYPKEVQQRLKGWDAEKLKKILDDRHSVVHSDKLPLTTLDELAQIKGFFEKTVINISAIIKATYNIWLDNEQMAERVERYRRYQEEQSKQQPSA